MNVNQKNDLRLFIELFGGIDESRCIFADETEIKSPDLLINKGYHDLSLSGLRRQET
jgi:hypothetical protein